MKRDRARRQGDKETRRPGEGETGRQAARGGFRLLVSVSRCLLVCLALSGLAEAKGPEAAVSEQRRGKAVARLQPERAEAESGQVRITQLLLTLSVEGQSPLTVEPSQAVTDSAGWTSFAIGAPARAPSKNGTTRWQAVYRLEAPANLEEDVLRLAPLRYREGGETAPWQVITWQPIPIKSRPNPGPEDPPLAPGLRPWVVGITTVVVFLGGSLVGWQLLRRRAKREASLPPSQRALRELERIDTLDLSAANDVKQFYTLLCDVVRQYIELRFRLPALERTTAEFLKEMRHSPLLTTNQQTFLREFLERCDLVKFAQAQSAPEDCRVLAKLARSFIEETATETALGHGLETGPSADDRPERRIG